MPQGGYTAFGGAHACTELSKPGRHRWFRARSHLWLQNQVTGLWGGVGFRRGDNPAASEQNAKGTCQDTQEKDITGLWDQQRVKDLRETCLRNCSPPPASLWAALFTRGREPASQRGGPGALLAPAICWPRAARGSEELRTHQAAGTCSSARKPPGRTWPLSPVSWSCPQSQSASFNTTGEKPHKCHHRLGGRQRRHQGLQSCV